MTIGDDVPPNEMIDMNTYYKNNDNFTNFVDTPISVLNASLSDFTVAVGKDLTFNCGHISVFDCELRFAKTHPDAKIPTKNHSTDTGFDVSSIEDKLIPARGSAVVDVGLKFAYITPGYWVKIEGRSGLGFKHGIIPHPGIIDNPYRGSAGIKLYNQTDTDYYVKAGDRIAQFIAYKNYSVSVSEGVVVESERGEKGFGSSGK